MCSDLQPRVPKKSLNIGANGQKSYTKAIGLGSNDEDDRQNWCYNRPGVKPSECNGPWCQPLYEAKAAGLVLYGRALGLSHGEAEDVVQETFVALLKLPRK